MARRAAATTTTRRARRGDAAAARAALSHGGGVSAEAAARIRIVCSSGSRATADLHHAAAPTRRAAAAAAPPTQRRRRCAACARASRRRRRRRWGSSAEWEASPIHPSFGRHFDRAAASSPTRRRATTRLGAREIAHLGGAAAVSAVWRRQACQLGALGGTGAGQGRRRRRRRRRRGRGGVEAEAEADDALEREWYEQEEGAHSVDSTHDPFLGDEAVRSAGASAQARQPPRDGAAQRSEPVGGGRLGASGVVRMMGDGDDDDDGNPTWSSTT